MWKVGTHTNSYVLISGGTVQCRGHRTRNELTKGMTFMCDFEDPHEQQAEYPEES